MNARLVLYLTLQAIGSHGRFVGKEGNSDLATDAHDLEKAGQLFRKHFQ